LGARTGTPPVPYWRPVLPALPYRSSGLWSDRFGRSVSGLSGEDSWALDPTYLPSDTPESCGIPQLRTHSAIGLRRIPDPHALLTHALSHRLHRERCVVPSSCVVLCCCLAELYSTGFPRVVQVVQLLGLHILRMSRCSPLGNRSPDHRHPGSPIRRAALLSSTLQALARLCKCRSLRIFGPVARPSVPLWRQAELCATCTLLSSRAGQSTFREALRAVLRACWPVSGPFPRLLGGKPRAGSVRGARG
jgi:hypothetical protein